MAVAAALAGGCVAVCFAFWPRERTVQGQIEVLQYAVRTQQSGGVIEVRVKEGDYIEVGDTLLLFKTDDTPMPEDETLELLAATLHPHRTGNRVLDRAYGRWQQAKAAEEQAQKAYREVQRQFLRGRVPAQLRDRAFADYKTFSGANHRHQARLRRDAVSSAFRKGWSEGTTDRGRHHKSGGRGERDHGQEGRTARALRSIDDHCPARQPLGHIQAQ